MNVKQSVDFNTQSLVIDGVEQAVQTTLLSGAPQCQKGINQESYVNQNGLKWDLYWDDIFDSNIMFESFTVQAICQQNEWVKIQLSADYLKSNKIDNSISAMKHVKQILDRFSAYESE